MSGEEPPDPEQTSPEPTRALIFAPTGRDAKLTAEILEEAGIESLVYPNIEALCGGITEGAGLVILTAEGLTPRSMKQIAGTLATQPAWSEIPLMIFVAQPDMERAARSFEMLGPLAQITLLDRPVRVRTLVSTARTAIAGRLRQYEIRDLLDEQRGRIRERQELLEKERAASRRLAELAEASIAIASALSLDEVMQMITDQARRVIDAEIAITSMSAGDDGETRSIHSVSTADGQSDLTSIITNGSRPALEAIALEMKGALRLDRHALEHHPLGELFDPAKVQTAMAAPLFERESRRVGVIVLAGKDRGDFTAEDEAVMTQLAQMASAAIQNARLYREAQEANRMKDDFLATLAHELRTPMTGILGWIQMLKIDSTKQEDVDRAISMIESSTLVQARLVEDLLDVSRIIAGKLRIEFAAVELAPIVEAVVDTFKARAEERGVKLEATIEQTPLSVYGDETRLHQVMWNLLSNAIKFTPEGGSVHISLERAASLGILRVSDTGKGVSPEFLPYVFERFRQADSSTTRQQAGLGLGLAIVRHLVELHGGHVTATSGGDNQGTTFTVSLPVLAVRFDPSEIGSLREADDIPTLEGIRILVVDDDPEARQMVSLVLGELGAEVHQVHSVQDAVLALRRISPDVIISDIAMPGEDGYALIRRVHEIQSQLGREVPAMALTGFGRPEDRARILASGFQRYVQKPVDPSELARAVAALIP